MNPVMAKDLSALIALPLVFLFISPVLVKYRSHSNELFSRARLSWRVVGIGIAIGVLARAAWWASVFVQGAAFAPESVSGTGLWPQWMMRCEPPLVLLVGVISLGLLTPVVEELVHRGLLQGYLYRYGAVVGITGSAAIFTAYHTPATWAAVFVMGVIFGLQFYWSGSLWPGLFTHITYNGLTFLDWHCLRGFWQPSAGEEGLSAILLAATAALVLLATLVLKLLLRLKNGAD